MPFYLTFTGAKHSKYKQNKPKPQHKDKINIMYVGD